jgi:hypothetical protein
MKRALLLLGVSAAACLLPVPPDPAPLPEIGPLILSTSVQPPTERVLTKLQGDLVVPVYLIDPSVQLEWRLYVDYDPSGVSSPNDPEGTAGRVARGVSLPLDTAERTRTLRIPLAQVADLASLSSVRCHVLELIVARAFVGESRRDGHTPKAPGGDSVSWFYSPAGTLEGCPVEALNPTPFVISDAGGQ